MAKAHMATPADPPATMIAPRFRSAGEEPAGVNILFVTSYAAKYLLNRFQTVKIKERTIHERGTARTVPCKRSSCPTEDASHPPLTIEMSYHINDALVPLLACVLALTLSLFRAVNW